MSFNATTLFCMHIVPTHLINAPLTLLYNEGRSHNISYHGEGIRIELRGPTLDVLKIMNGIQPVQYRIHVTSIDCGHWHPGLVDQEWEDCR